MAAKRRSWVLHHRFNTAARVAMPHTSEQSHPQLKNYWDEIFPFRTSVLGYFYLSLRLSSQGLRTLTGRKQRQDLQILKEAA